MPIGSSRLLAAPNVAAGEILHVDGAVAGEDGNRNSCHDHGDQRADERGVRRNTELQDQLNADDRAEQRQQDQKNKGGRSEGRGMPRAGRAGFCGAERRTMVDRRHACAPCGQKWCTAPAAAWQA